MSTLDYYKKSWESIKDRTPKEKFEYLLYYYKWYAIGVLLFLVFLVHFIYSNVTAKEAALNGIFMNAYTTPEALTTFKEDLNLKLTIDTSEYEIALNTNLSYITDNTGEYNNYELYQSLQVWYAAGELDFLVGNFEFMTTMAYQGFFVDLSEVLTKEQYAFYEPYFHYIDRDILNKDNISGKIVLPDSTNPSSMKDPVPVFIDISSCDKLSPIYDYDTDNLFFGMMPNAPHMKRAIIVLDYLMEL